MQVPNKWSLFGYGALGGVMPTVASLASTYVASPETPLPAIGMYLGLALWAFVGGGVALMNTGLEIRHAIFAGIAAPAIIMNIFSGAYEHPSRTKIADMLVLSASAQESMNPKAPLAVIIQPNVSGGIPSSVSLPVTADVETNGKTETVKIGEIRDLISATGFAVPKGTSMVFVSGMGVPINSTVTNVDLSVKTRPTSGGDFLWALGFPRNYSIRGMNVYVAPPKTDK